MRRIVASAGALLDVLQEFYKDSSKTTLRNMLQSGRVRVNGEIEKDAKRRIDADDVIHVAQKSMQIALPPGLAILHEDDQLIVVLKSHGLLTVATERERENTVQAYLNDYMREKGEGRIHFATREALKERFAAHAIDRVYVAVIEGTINPPSGTIRSHLLERRDLRMQSVDAHPDAKLAVSHYRTIQTAPEYSMLEVTLETGRKNQIRAHLSEAGHPVVGDGD